MSLKSTIFLIFAIKVVYSIELKTISPERDIFHGEYMHFIWYSEYLECQDVHFSMMDSTNKTVHTFTCEREAGFCKRMMPCIPSGEYKFLLKCENNYDYSRKIQFKSATQNLDFYMRSSNIYTWNFIRVLIQLKMNILTYPDMNVIKSDSFPVDVTSENSQMELALNDNTNYIMKGYDICNVLVGESKVFSKISPLEKENTRNKPAPAPVVPGPGPSEYTYPSPSPSSPPSPSSNPSSSPSPSSTDEDVNFSPTNKVLYSFVFASILFLIF